MRHIKKITIAIDSFKGCASSLELAGAIEKGALSVIPSCIINKVPVGDGGEGSVRALTENNISVDSYDPLLHKIKASYGVVNDRALIEVAAAGGLSLINPDERNIMAATSYGTGVLIADALMKGYLKITLFLGGSATNDAGLGMLEALGYRFYDANGTLIHPCGGHLSYINHIDDSEVIPNLRDCDIEVACDVENPFFGIDGAAYVFAPQKGADDTQVVILDNGLRHIAEIIKKDYGKDINIKGAGAAGGIGGICMTMLNAKFVYGISYIMESLQLKEKASGSDLIITGEGRMDFQTLSGKVPFGVLQTAKKLNIPVVAICGSVDKKVDFNAVGFSAVFSIQMGPASLQESMDKVTALQNIENVSAQIVRMAII